MPNLQHPAITSKGGVYRLRISRAVPGRVELVPVADHDPVDLKNAIYDWIAQHDLFERQQISAAQIRRAWPGFVTA